MTNPYTLPGGLVFRARQTTLMLASQQAFPGNEVPLATAQRLRRTWPERAIAVEVDEEA